MGIFKMKKIALMDTSIMSFNTGDQIIMESVKKGLEGITSDAFIVSMPTHSPLFHKYEFSIRKKDGFARSLELFDLKFVCGTNLLSKNMMKRKNIWNMHLLDARFINDFILVGVGTDSLDSIQNNYTLKIYQRLLSHKYKHSVRDERTKIMLEDMGFEAINTGCATLWPLNKQHCDCIPNNKSNCVVFTVTDYCRDDEKDKELVNTLLNSYDNVYFWPQGIFDDSYLNELWPDVKSNKISYISPTLRDYDKFLRDNECDYVGTRLHAGIKAMQLGRRAVIISVDNRAKDMSETFGLPILERDNLSDLEDVIYGRIKIQINVRQDKIDEFLNQFMKVRY